MKRIFLISSFLLLIILQFENCKNASTCNQLDSSCNPISSIVLERAIRNSRYGLTFSPPGGTYKYDPFVTITSNSTATIRYTLDGSEPSCTNGTIYTAPAPILGAKSQTLRAAACVDSVVAATKTDQYTVTLSPLAASNLRFWYSADSIGNIPGLEVKVWNDYSGNGNHLYPSSTGTSSPTIVANALNGKAAVRLTSTQKQFFNSRSATGYIGSKAGVGAMVLRKYSSQTDEVYFSIGFLGNVPNARNWKANTTNQSICSSLSPAPTNCAGAATTAIPTTGYNMILFSTDASGVTTYYYNGVADGTGTIATPTAFSSANVFLLGTGLNVVNYLDAEILEVIFFETGFDAGGINTIHCYIQNKYGLAVGSNCT
ncbi:MAG TPA: chitobiase/beta-hexosaminidase C-terminal domain-containing protein [Leptospiraceae bacterium]|nr:chitobiase/beta-hexosaminidase C-terminal domain-containing protein [Leptospiraceae bacterium]HMW05111.1 chitobiase/beta-hexosaminidase C-terminal domain-containing protein [Leptospiraceae bacterium]HMX31365.1 chitobiase/beta-hexosaminidase C-terminal domain-containing protein [Leptospiraceae bacterium]HMY31592.1 chitobiase/beta-hexosaminidase C-terminal domain-containing protein [Leptospiraceae bacterium]HMZ66859.1 chitobiase/beta-hexosaminidase C-terminal domain-containing protein [Leptosp